MNNGIETLIEIENGLGRYAEVGLAESTRRDAGRLIDAMKQGLKPVVESIYKKHWKQMIKGQVQGGPKQVKLGCPVRAKIARISEAWLANQ